MSLDHHHSMIEAERQDRIVSMLRDRRHLSIHDLIETLGASEPTIRRDLQKLGASGRIRRVRGGAAALEDDRGYEPHRECAAIEAKRRIAERAAALCMDGDSIAIDAGSTTYQLASFLRARDLLVLTNSFPLAERLMAESRCRVVLSAGEIDRQRGAILDPFGRAAFADYACTRLFMSAQSCDRMGVHNDDRSVIRSEQQLLRVARELVLLVDSRKFKRRGTLRLCDWETVDLLITDDGISEEARAMLDEQGVAYEVI